MTPELIKYVAQAITDVLNKYDQGAYHWTDWEEEAVAAIAAYESFPRHNEQGYNCRQKTRIDMSQVTIGDPYCPICPPISTSTLMNGLR